MKPRGNVCASLITGRACDDDYGAAGYSRPHLWVHDDRASHRLFKRRCVASVVKKADLVVSERQQGRNAGEHPLDRRCRADRYTCDVCQGMWFASHEEAGLPYRSFDQGLRSSYRCAHPVGVFGGLAAFIRLSSVYR